MREQIRYVPDGIVLDLSEPDTGHPDGLNILQYHYRQSERPNLGFSKAHPAFVSHRLPAPMSDEHKRQTEYWARAARDAGWDVELEHSLHTGTRPDALIHGPMVTGVEVQRSAMTPGRAVERTAKAVSAGVTDVWFSDWTLPRDASSRQLFPGRSPARPVAPQTLTRRLRQHGIESRQARNTALAAWASDLPPAVLASLLGVHIQTAVNWASRTRRDWTAYLAERAQPV